MNINNKVGFMMKSTGHYY